MTDEDLLNEALYCIYEIKGEYENCRDPKYPHHKDEIEELERVTSLLEKRLGRGND